MQKTIRKAMQKAMKGKYLSHEETNGYKEGFLDGYNAGFEQGMKAGHDHYEKHKAAELAANDDMLNRAMDARIDGILLEHGIGIDQMLANRGVQSQQAYQGVNNLCAYCGQPVGDTPVQDQDDKANTYLYCSDKCWQLHGWG